MTPTLYKIDGTSQELQPLNGTDFTFEELYPHLNTDIIEMIYLHDGTIMLLDEEGSFKKDREVNTAATNIAVSALKEQGRTILNPLVGVVLHCDSECIK